MSDLTLSQDEIDALLMGGGGGGGGGGSSQPAQKGLSSSEESALKAMFKDAVPGLTNALAGMINGKKVTLNLPTFDLVDKDGLLDNLSQEVVELRADFTGDLNADHAFYLDPEDAVQLAGAIMGQAEVELNETGIGALEEMASMLSGSLVTTLSRKTTQQFAPGPVGGQKTVKATISTSSELLITATWTVMADSDSYRLIEVFDASFLRSMTGAGGGTSQQGNQSSQAGASQQVGMPSSYQPQQFGAPQQGFQPQGGYPPQGFPQQGYPPQGYPQQGGYPPPGYPPQGYAPGPGMYPAVQGVQLPHLNSGYSPGEQGNIGLLMDVAMEVTVELGRAKKQIKEILSMGEGTIIALDKLAGEAVDILVNHKLIAKGEVVVIDENFGVRVTEIVSNPDKAMDS